MTIRVTVDRAWREAEDVRAFDLVAAEGGVLPGFTAGSHIDVHLRSHLIRQYSLCNGPGDGARYTIAVKREAESSGGSSAMHDELEAGDLLEIGGPRNNFPLDPAAEHSILLAGGIGVTPLLGMARHLAAANASFQLEYFTRSAEHTAFRGALVEPGLQERAALHAGLDLTAVDARLRQVLAQPLPRAHVYLCGPLPFMDLARGVAAGAGWAAERVHLEYFKAEPSAAARSQPEGAFEIQLSRTGATYEVPPDKTIVEVLAAHGIDVPVSCEQGVCGTCLTAVLAGEPDHRDMFLTPEEHAACDQMTVCVSRSKSPRLVLDL